MADFEIKDGVLVKYNGTDENAVIPDGVTAIDEFAFIRCTHLKSVYIPGSVISIGKSSFLGCKGLKNIKIPGSVTSIDKWAFFGCSSLRGITIPVSVVFVGEEVFGACDLRTIYCEADGKPWGWRSNWNSGCCANVIWNCKE